MGDKPSAGIDPLVSRNAAREAFAKALKLYVGYRGSRRHFKMAELSEGSGVPVRVIECAMEDADSPEYRNPPLCAVLSLCTFLGAEFTSKWLRKAGQGAFNLPDDETPPGVLAAESAEDNAVLARAAADGEFQDHEKPDLHVVAERMIERGQRLAAA